jgi:hypothetical protein
VPFSRFKSFANMAVLRDFQIRALQAKPDPNLLAEMRRLKKIYEAEFGSETTTKPSVLASGKRDHCPSSPLVNPKKKAHTDFPSEEDLLDLADDNGVDVDDLDRGTRRAYSATNNSASSSPQKKAPRVDEGAEQEDEVPLTMVFDHLNTLHRNINKGPIRASDEWLDSTPLEWIVKKCQTVLGSSCRHDHQDLLYQAGTRHNQCKESRSNNTCVHLVFVYRASRLQAGKARENQHWCFSASRSPTSKGPVLYDSLKVTSPEKSRLLHMQQTYGCGSAFTTPAIAQQPNGYDCGLYTAANAVSIALGQDPTHCIYKNAEMRKHFLHIIETKVLTLFPCEVPV